MGSSKHLTKRASVAVLPAIEEIPIAIESLRASIGTRPEGFRFSRHICTVSANLANRHVVVTGEDQIAENAQAKAISELIERTSLIAHGDRFGVRTSNGWAAHPNEAIARQNAIRERIERDAVLSHWYAARSFLVLAGLPLEIEQWKRTELAVSELPRMTILLSTDGIGPSVTCILQNQSGFGVCGHATRGSLDESIDAALAEACRSAHAFVRHDHWRETRRLTDPNDVVTEPEAHSLFYAYVEPFPAWMFGQSITLDAARTTWAFRLGQAGDDHQLSFQMVAKSPIFVGFASHPQAFELTWGCTLAQHVARSSAAHRIGLATKDINLQPHIVS